MKENPVMLYMKGVPEAPQCGFSSLAVRVLQQYSKFLMSTCSCRLVLKAPFLFETRNLTCCELWCSDVPIGARNILEDQDLKNAVKSFRSDYAS